LDLKLPRAHGRKKCEFRSKARAFEDLNMMVRLEVMAKIGRPKRSKGCEIADPAHFRFTLDQWRTFARKVLDNPDFSEI